MAHSSVLMSFPTTTPNTCLPPRTAYGVMFLFCGFVGATLYGSSLGSSDLRGFGSMRHVDNSEIAWSTRRTLVNMRWGGLFTGWSGIGVWDSWSLPKKAPSYSKVSLQAWEILLGSLGMCSTRPEVSTGIC